MYSFFFLTAINPLPCPLGRKEQFLGDQAKVSSRMWYGRCLRSESVSHPARRQSLWQRQYRSSQPESENQSCYWLAVRSPSALNDRPGRLAPQSEAQAWSALFPASGPRVFSALILLHVIKRKVSTWPNAQLKLGWKDEKADVLVRWTPMRDWLSFQLFVETQQLLVLLVKFTPLFG